MQVCRLEYYKPFRTVLREAKEEGPHPIDVLRFGYLKR